MYGISVCRAAGACFLIIHDASEVYRSIFFEPRLVPRGPQGLLVLSREFSRLIPAVRLDMLRLNHTDTLYRRNFLHDGIQASTRIMNERTKGAVSGSFSQVAFLSLILVKRHRMWTATK